MNIAVLFKNLLAHKGLVAKLAKVVELPKVSILDMPLKIKFCIVVFATVFERAAKMNYSVFYAVFHNFLLAKCLFFFIRKF